jgi:potassium efflux system protein
MNYASGGNGTILHLGAEMFLDEAGGKARHIPYKGVGPMVRPDRRPGRLRHRRAAQRAAAPQGGRAARPSASAPPQRVAGRTRHPTFVEQGVPGYVVEAWFAVIGPKGLPAAEVKRVHGGRRRVRRPRGQGGDGQAGQRDPGLAPDKAAMPFFRSELAKYAALVKKAGVEAQSQAAHARHGLDLAELHRARHDLEQRMLWVSRRASVNALGGEFAQTLSAYLAQLPRREQFEVAAERRAALIAAASDEELRVGRALERPGPPPGETTPASGEREALHQLGTALAANVEVLRQIDESAREYKEAATAARTKLTEYLFWIPASRSIDAWAGLVPAWQWTVSADNWRSAGSVATKEFGRAPFWPLVALVVAGALLLGRGRIRRAMDAVSPVRLGGQRYRMAHAFAALGLTLLLAVPLPILLRTLAHLLGSAPPAQPFALALSDALNSVSFLSMGLLACVNLLAPNGLLIAHFGQEGLQLQAVARELRRFAVLFVLVIFLAALNMSNHSPFANHESLGRSLFSLALMISSVFSWRTFRRNSPFVQGLVARAPRSWAVRLHPLWAGLLVLAPVAVAGLAASGYFVAAVYFWIRTLDSLFLALGAALLYALARLWVGLQRQQLSRARDAEAALQAGRDATDEPADTLAAQARPPLPDVAAIGEQARSLLNLLVSLLFLTGLAFVWRDAMPALSVIGEFTLWRTHSVVNGTQVVHALTVGQLGGAILIGVITGLAVNRVAGLLDIVGMSQLGFQADATYAIKAVTRYSLAAAGVLVASSILGIGWGDVQWLVAALGVGLGFGLQEIVANFVSGLIVLAERPIRIGDVITVDKTTGKVARIRARATVVVDFDNKEVIIPNKTFITAPVVNWTLSSQVSRLVLKVGVPLGSNIAAIQQRIVEEVGLLPDVLSNPPPAVFFTAFADKNLEFEIHAYVGSLNDRFRVQHEINLAAERVLREQGADAPPS